MALRLDKIRSTSRKSRNGVNIPAACGSKQSVSLASVSTFKFRLDELIPTASASPGALKNGLHTAFVSLADASSSSSMVQGGGGGPPPPIDAHEHRTHTLIRKSIFKDPQSSDIGNS